MLLEGNFKVPKIEWKWNCNIPNLWDFNEVLRENSIGLNAYIKHVERSPINNDVLEDHVLKKKKKNKHKNMYMGRYNVLDWNFKSIQRIVGTNCVFDKIKKVDRTLDKLTKRKKRSKIIKLEMGEITKPLFLPLNYGNFTWKGQITTDTEELQRLIRIHLKIYILLNWKI